MNNADFSTGFAFLFLSLCVTSHWNIQKSDESEFAELGQMIAEGSLLARVQACYPIDQIKKAVAVAAAGGRDGKILIDPKA